MAFTFKITDAPDEYDDCFPSLFAETHPLPAAADPIERGPEMRESPWKTSTRSRPSLWMTAKALAHEAKTIAILVAR
jgi:hypothetical protein